MKHIDPAWTSARADLAGLEALHTTLIQLLIQGIHPDLAAAQLELLTAKLPPKDLESLKKVFPRQGFVRQWEAIEDSAKEFQKELLDKKNAAPSATWKLLTSYAPEAVLWLAFTSKNTAVQTKFKNFYSVWPEARQKIPTALMLEMRITPQLPGYEQLVQEIFFRLMDGKLATEEEMRAFLEPHSPPAPPPPVSIRRTRAKKSEAKFKDEDEDEDVIPTPGDLDDEEDGDDDDDEDDSDGDTEDEELPIAKPVKAKAIPAKAMLAKGSAAASAPAHGAVKVSAKSVPSKAEEKPVPVAPVKPAPAKTAKPVVPAKTHSPAKAAAVLPKKAPVKSAQKKVVVAAKKPAPAKKVVKPAAKKAAKPVAKAPKKPTAAAARKPAAKVTKKPAAKPVKKKR
jgi:hypothetical protein